MGEVYRARDTKLNRDVALKILPDRLARDPDRLARFHREAQVLAALNHPNIAHIYGLEDSDGIARWSWNSLTATMSRRSSTRGAMPARRRASHRPPDRRRARSRARDTASSIAT